MCYSKSVLHGKAAMCGAVKRYCAAAMFETAEQDREAKKKLSNNGKETLA